MKNKVRLAFFALCGIIGTLALSVAPASASVSYYITPGELNVYTSETPRQEFVTIVIENNTNRTITGIRVEADVPWFTPINVRIANVPDSLPPGGTAQVSATVAVGKVDQAALWRVRFILSGREFTGTARTFSIVINPQRH